MKEDKAEFTTVVCQLPEGSRRGVGSWCLLDLAKQWDGNRQLDPFCRPVIPFVLEDFFLGKGTSVASIETVFEIVKYIADVDMLPRRRMG